MIEVLGIDVGGTTTRVELFRRVDGGLHEIGRWSGDTDRADATAGIREGIATLGEQNDLGDIRACGIGVPEYVHDGRLRSDLVLRLVERFDAAEGATLDPAALGLPDHASVHIESDVRCGAIAEWHALGVPGASCLYISLGTGLSSAFVLPGGVCWSGHAGSAISLGEWTSPLAGATLEDFASGAGIARRHRDGARGDDRSTLQLAEAAAAGDAVALALLSDAGTAVGNAVRQLHAVLDPEFVIVGGGLGSADGPVWDALSAAAVVPIPGRAPLALRRAALGGRSGALGAAWVAVRESGA